MFLDGVADEAEQLHRVVLNLAVDLGKHISSIRSTGYEARTNIELDPGTRWVHEEIKHLGEQRDRLTRGFDSTDMS